MYTIAIIPAAGYGLRLKNRVLKPLIKIEGIPILVYTLKAVTQHPLIKEVVVVVNQSNIRAIESNIKRYRINKISDIVLGGDTRRISVENGLRAVGSKADLVLIHDAVRPFIKQSVISKVIDEARRTGAAIVGVPVKATIKKVAGCRSPVAGGLIVEKTVDRSSLWEIQTPQVFRKDLILKAYKRYKDINVTDDAILIERLGVKVSLVMGSYENIKITTPEDLVIAEAICKNLKCHTG
jgi:2-C-methyl-D-erythritol 4-phosphate cytidylyltransferase